LRVDFVEQELALIDPGVVSLCGKIISIAWAIEGMVVTGIVEIHMRPLDKS